MASAIQTITYPRHAAQELVAFLGKLPVESGAGLHYVALRSALETLETAPEPLSPAKVAKILNKASKTPTKASPAADDAKTIARKKHAAANARKWRARKAAERAAALEAQKKDAAEPTPITIETSPEPVLFTDQA